MQRGNGIEHDDVRSIMLSLMDLHERADHIIDLLEDDGEEEEEAEADR